MRRCFRIDREAPADLAGGVVVRALGFSRAEFYPWLTRARNQRTRSDEELSAPAFSCAAIEPMGPGGCGTTCWWKACRERFLAVTGAQSSSAMASAAADWTSRTS